MRPAVLSSPSLASKPLVKCGFTGLRVFSRLRRNSTRKPSTMPKQTLIFAALLIALGLGAFFVSGSRTALMPAYPGVLLAIFAGLALAFDGARRHFMHAAAA